MEVDVFQVIRGRAVRRVDFQDDVVLIELREQSGDLTLPEAVVQCVIDILSGQPQARCGGSIELERGDPALVLTVRRNVL